MDRAIRPKQNVQVVVTYVIHEVFPGRTFGGGFDVAENLRGQDEPLIVIIPLLRILHHRKIAQNVDVVFDVGIPKALQLP